MQTPQRKEYMRRWRELNMTKDRARRYYKKWSDKSWDKYYGKNKEKRKENVRKWVVTEKGKQHIKLQGIIAIKLRPKAVKAKRILNHVIASGKIVRKPCNVCGSNKSQGHHPNYDYPLRVKWLCAQHHKNLHVKLDKRKARAYDR